MHEHAIVPVQPRDYLLVRLVTASDGARTPKQLARDLKSRLSETAVSDALSHLAATGLVTLRPRVTLTDDGREAVTQRFGPLRRDKKWLATRIEPALALGFPPAGALAGRIARADTLRAIVLTHLYQLPLYESTLTLSQAISALVTRRLAGLHIPGVAPALVQAAPRLDDLADIGKLRVGLLRVALHLGLSRGRPSGGTDGDGVEPSAGGEDPAATPQFVERVKTLVNTHAAGPFTHKIPISHVYDLYGERYPDVGSLASFKRRLQNAASEGMLGLLPLDDPNALDDDSRVRSEIVTPTRRLHFIERRRS